jgi:hypothetical protein
MVQSYDQLKEMPWLTFMSTVELSQSVQSTSVGQQGGAYGVDGDSHDMDEALFH